MFGNRLGWGISSVIVFLAVMLGRLVYQTAHPSPATGWIQKTIQPIGAAPSLDKIIPALNEHRNAGDFYRLVISDYRENPGAYDAKPPTAQAAEGVRALLDGARCDQMDLFASDPARVVSYEHDKDGLIALNQVVQATLDVARRSDPAVAGRCYAAVLVLGVKLYQERVVFDELAMGEELMGIGCGGLKGLAHRAGDAAEESRIEQFDVQRLAMNAAQVQPIWAVLGSLDMNTISAYSGDWFALVNDKTIDPMWRVETALKLGEVKYSAARLADQKYAQRLLKELADDSREIPAVRAGARAGRDLTIEQYRSLR
jgi:hypothetical protein